MKQIRLYPQLELLNTWAIDRTRFSPDAAKPPLCLRCGQPLSPVLSHNALSRYVDVHICAACGMDEAMGDATQTQKWFLNWAAVAEHWLKVPAEDDVWVLKPTCPFSELYLDTSVDQLGHKSPRTELAYARSDYDGRRWWTTWFTVRENLKMPDRTAEIDQFMDALFSLPEMASLETMCRMCRVYAEPTSDPTEFNLYCDTNHFHVWMRLIIRKRDYNLYIHFHIAAENKYATS